ncbi:MAG: isopeptide-forming domain-containing fimbrial protein, partial [Clostridiales bacterium]|nr:isopeptide-forming domain-containing fimbrial protein [Clostridiales bacterium]
MRYYFTWYEPEDGVDVTYNCENATEGPTSYSRMESQWDEDYNDGNTGSGYVAGYISSKTASKAEAGETLTVVNWGDGYDFKTTNGMIQLFDGRSAFFMTHSNGTGSGVVWIYQGYKYSTDGGTTWSDLVNVYEETGETVTYNGYTWPEYDLVSTIINVPEDSTGVSIAYQFTAAATTNFIYELRDNRLVYQDGTLLAASSYENTEEGTWDTYNVSSTENITVTYTPTMSMENLGSDLFTFLSWDVLQAYETSITNDTRIYLHFFFDTNYIDLANSDFSEAYLESDMFDLVDESTSETPISIDASTGEVLVTCQWDSESADAIYKAEGALDPMIYFKNFTLAVTDDWGEDVTSITIFNDGYVDGVVDMDSTGPFSAGKFAIWGGYEDDTFILQLAGKISEPDIDKTILTDKGSANQDDVAAGDTVNFQLTSAIPDTLKDHITYTLTGNDGQVVGTVNSTTETDETTGNETTTTDTYYLIFHDVMDSHLTLNEGSITVAINGETLDSKYYTATTSGLSDDCTFEVSIELLKLYTDEIIDETYFGTATVTVTYTATLDEDATHGSYPNKAWVTYNGTKSEEDKVEVDTYAIQIVKYDQSKASASDATSADASARLEGAKFALYKTYADAEAGENAVNTYTSDANGYITIEGLDVGTYYLVETEAPEGFVKSGTPVTVVVDSDKADEENIVLVVFANAPIPSTGGAGTRMYLIGGACLIAAAGTVFVVSRRKK